MELINRRLVLVAVACALMISHSSAEGVFEPGVKPTDYHYGGDYKAAFRVWGNSFELYDTCSLIPPKLFSGIMC